MAGNLTLNLTDVTLDEVMAVAQDMYGYDIEKRGEVIPGLPCRPRTVTIPVDYLQVKRSGRSH